MSFVWAFYFSRWDFRVAPWHWAFCVGLFALGFSRWAFRVWAFRVWAFALGFPRCVFRVELFALGFSHWAFRVWVFALGFLAFGVRLLVVLVLCHSMCHVRFSVFGVGVQPAVCFCWAVGWRCALGFLLVGFSYILQGNTYAHTIETTQTI